MSPRFRAAILFLSFTLSGMRCGGSLSTPVTSETESGGADTMFTDVVTEGGSTCALGDLGNVYCWGGNDLLLFSGSTSSAEQVTPLKMSSIPKTSQLFARYQNICGVTADSSSFWCLGKNLARQMGDGGSSPLGYDSSNLFSKTFQEFLASSSAIVPDRVMNTGCAITANGSAKCWGDNSSGQIGDATTTNRSTPTSTDPSPALIQISSNLTHTCAVAQGGSVYCWGEGGSGQIGDGTTNNPLVPTSTNGFLVASKVVTVQSTSCALLTSGAIKCWGNNKNGTVGDGGGCATPCSTPQSVIGVTGAIGLYGAGNAYIAVLSDGSAKCWGSNLDGQFGNGATSAFANSTPSACVTGLSDIKSISIGDDNGSTSVCAVTNGGSVYCWGGNSRSQLGVSSDSTPTSLTPYGPITP